MDLTQTPYFAMLKARIAFASERQRVIAENVANVSTPGFVPTNLDEESFRRTLEAAAPGAGGGVRLARTAPGHMPATTAVVPAGGFEALRRADNETTVDGNRVVIEEQMLKLAKTRQDFDAAMALYQKGLDMIRMAARAPGR